VQCSRGAGEVEPQERSLLLPRFPYLPLAFPHLDRRICVLSQQSVGERSGGIVVLAGNDAVIDHIVSVVEKVTAIEGHGYGVCARLYARVTGAS